MRMRDNYGVAIVWAALIGLVIVAKWLHVPLG